MASLAPSHVSSSLISLRDSLKCLTIRCLSSLMSQESTIADDRDIRISGSSQSIDQSVDVGNLGEVAQQRPKRKAIKAGSTIREHFTKFNNEAGEKKAKCHYCGNVLTSDPVKNGIIPLK